MGPPGPVKARLPDGAETMSGEGSLVPVGVAVVDVPPAPGAVVVVVEPPLAAVAGPTVVDDEFVGALGDVDPAGGVDDVGATVAEVVGSGGMVTGSVLTGPGEPPTGVVGGGPDSTVVGVVPPTTVGGGTTGKTGVVGGVVVAGHPGGVPGIPDAW